MNPLDYWQSLFSEFGMKTRFLIHDYRIIDAMAMYLKLNRCYTIYNLIAYLGKYGVIEVIDIIDEAALQFISQ